MSERNCPSCGAKMVFVVPGVYMACHNAGREEKHEG